MAIFSDLKYRLRAIFGRQAMDHELNHELRFHYERQVGKYIQAGMTRDEAIRQTRLAMGSVEQVKEECRDARGVSVLEATMQDLRFGLRQLRKSPGFAAVVVISLALGIGANTAIYTLLDTVLFRMLPVAEPTELHFLQRHQPNSSSTGFAYNEFRRMRAQNPVFADVAAYSTARLNVSIDGSSEPTAEGQLVSGSFFRLLGVNAVVGRTIGPEDDLNPNGHPVAVLSYNYWKRRFGMERSAIGRSISLSGTPFTIIGVAPPEFFGLEVGRAADIFVPVMMQPTVMPSAENWLGESIVISWWLTVVGRLNSDRSSQQAAAILASLDVLEPLMTKPSRPGEQSERIPERLGLRPAATGLSSLRQQFSQPLLVLMAVVGVVLLIACANVANLVLARAASRVPEFSMRLALGAGRRRLIRQLLIENVVLALLGGAFGLVLARWATGLLVTFMSSGRTPIALDLEPDLRILAFTAGVSILTGILCGLAPALRASRIDVISGLKGHARGTVAGGHWLGPGKILVVSQVALCLLLLFGAGLFMRSLQKLDGQDDGFDRDTLLVVRVEPRGSDQRGIEGASARLDNTYRDLLERVAAIPGVRSASLAHFSPINRVGFASPVRLPSGDVKTVPRLMVYPSYFETMGIPIRAGRDLTSRDLGANPPFIGVVNEAFVRQFMNGENPVGKLLFERSDRPREIIGVVKDTRYASLRGETPPLMYQPFLQTNTGRGQMTLHVRVAPGAAGVASRVREEVQRIDKDMPLFTLYTLAAQMEGVLMRERLVATLSSLFGLLALLLASVGLYGLMAFAVVRRTAEMGIRMALGAAKRTVVSLVMREALRLVLIGLAIGVPVALLAGRLASSLVSGLLFGLSATDPVTLMGAALVLTLVAALAAYLPAVRAARVDPIVALRAE
jgi:predicted permease